MQDSLERIPRTKVLVVDDDPDFRETLSAFLTSSGLQVVQACDGPEGVRMAMTEQPQVIVMDIMMNERTEGLFAVQSIRRLPELRDTAVIVVSSLYSDVKNFSISPETGWFGHDEFFPKPVDFPRLLAAIEGYAGRGAATTQQKGHETP